MSIIIIGKPSIALDETNQPVSRAVKIYITDGTDAYIYGVGGLPLTGSLQTVLNGMETELYTEASANGVVPTSTDEAIVEAIQWYLANGGAKSDVFDKPLAQLHTDITAMVAASFPSASAAVRTGWVRTLMSGLLDTRVNAHDRELV